MLPLNEEHRLVPYQVSELPPGPWLVFAPHADDETFGMGGALLRAKEAGLETHVIVLTDGALGGVAESAEELVATRQQEVRRATGLLGVRSLELWTEKDRGLEVHQALLEKIAEAITRLGAASVFFPGPLELHPDHRITAQLVWQALQRLAAGPGQAPSPVLPHIYSYEISMQSPANLLLDITAQMPAKQQAMACYDSQNAENGYPNLIEALNRARTFTLPDPISHAEAFFHYQQVALKGSLRESAEQALALYW